VIPYLLAATAAIAAGPAGWYAHHLRARHVIAALLATIAEQQATLTATPLADPQHRAVIAADLRFRLAERLALAPGYDLIPEGAVVALPSESTQWRAAA
jgi:hypothetical protein